MSARAESSVPLVNFPSTFKPNQGYQTAPHRLLHCKTFSFMHGAKKRLNRLLQSKSAQAGASGASNVSQPSDATEVVPDVTSNEPSSGTSAANTTGQATVAWDVTDGTIPSRTRANIRKAGDTTINALDTSLAILKEVAGALQGVPFVKSVTGIVLVLIKIREVRWNVFFSRVESRLTPF